MLLVATETYSRGDVVIATSNENLRGRYMSFLTHNEAHQHVAGDTTNFDMAVKTAGDLLYSPLGHTHPATDITGLDAAVRAICDPVYALINHTHTTAQVTGLDAALLARPTGGGTLNKLAKWTPTGIALGDSRITDNGTTFGFNIAPNPAAEYYVNATANTGLAWFFQNVNTLDATIPNVMQGFVVQQQSSSNNAKTFTTMTGLTASASVGGSNTTATNIFGTTSTAQVFGGKTGLAITNVVSVQAQFGGGNGSSGTLTNLIGFKVRGSQSGWNSYFPDNWYGVFVETLNVATQRSIGFGVDVLTTANRALVSLGQTLPPAGAYALHSASPDKSVLSGDLDLVGKSYFVSGVQVLTARQPAVVDATNSVDVITQLNALLARVRTHGIIE